MNGDCHGGILFKAWSLVCLMRMGIKNSSVSLVVMEMQTNSKRCHFSPVKLLQIFFNAITPCWQGRREASWCCWTECKRDRFWKAMCQRAAINMKLCTCSSLGFSFFQLRKQKTQFLRTCSIGKRIISQRKCGCEKLQDGPVQDLVTFTTGPGSHHASALPH